MNNNEFIVQAFTLKMLEQQHAIITINNSLLAIAQPTPSAKCSNLLELELEALNNSEFVNSLLGYDYVVYFPQDLENSILGKFSLALKTTQTLLQACVEAQIKKFVLISSIAVYGDPPPSGTITEASPYLASTNPQCSLLQAIEKIVLGMETPGMDVIVLQLAQVYGPGGETTKTLEQLQSHFVSLPRQGSGYCNPIFIDDVVTAIAQACEHPNLHRQRFIISPNQPILWRDFLASCESILSTKALIHLPIDYVCTPQDTITRSQGLISGLLKKRKVQDLITAIAKTLYGKSIDYPSVDEFRSLAAQPIFSNQKAADRLNFQPAVSLSMGMQKIREWWQQQPLAAR